MLEECHWICAAAGEDGAIEIASPIEDVRDGAAHRQPEDVLVLGIETAEHGAFELAATRVKRLPICGDGSSKIVLTVVETGSCSTLLRAMSFNPDLWWVPGMSFGLQLFLLVAAQALRREAETARALAQTNGELRSAQAIIADAVRDAERLRISRELHDAWGHELTALGLQLEIASHVSAPGRVHDHVMQAKALAGALLGKVRDVVATLREAQPCDLRETLEALAHSVPRPDIHVDVPPGVRINPDQAHALMRCAQEAITNAIRHAEASNLWLQVTSDDEGVRLVARNDGRARTAASAPGSGLLGMRERVESLGGKLGVQKAGGLGFTVDAWLPSGAPRAA